MGRDGIVTKTMLAHGVPGAVANLIQRGAQVSVKLRRGQEEKRGCAHQMTAAAGGALERLRLGAPDTPDTSEPRQARRRHEEPEPDGQASVAEPGAGARHR